MNLVSLESLLIHLLDNAQISIFSKVDVMYLLLYWVTYSHLLKVIKSNLCFYESLNEAKLILKCLLLILI